MKLPKCDWLLFRQVFFSGFWYLNLIQSNMFDGYRKPALNCSLMPRSVLLHVLWIFPTQKQHFFVMASSWYSFKRSDRDVNEMNNLEHFTDGLLYSRSEETEGGERLKAQGFLLQHLDCLSSFQWKWELFPVSGVSAVEKPVLFPIESPAATQR